MHSSIALREDQMLGGGPSKELGLTDYFSSSDPSKVDWATLYKKYCVIRTINPRVCIHHASDISAALLCKVRSALNDFEITDGADSTRPPHIHLLCMDLKEKDGQHKTRALYQSLSETEQKRVIVFGLNTTIRRKRNSKNKIKQFSNELNALYAESEKSLKNSVYAKVMTKMGARRIRETYVSFINVGLATFYIGMRQQNKLNVDVLKIIMEYAVPDILRQTSTTLTLPKTLFSMYYKKALQPKLDQVYPQLSHFFQNQETIKRLAEILIAIEMYSRQAKQLLDCDDSEGNKKDHWETLKKAYLETMAEKNKILQALESAVKSEISGIEHDEYIMSTSAWLAAFYRFADRLGFEFNKIAWMLNSSFVNSLASDLSTLNLTRDRVQSPLPPGDTQGLQLYLMHNHDTDFVEVTGGRRQNSLMLHYHNLHGETKTQEISRAKAREAINAQLAKLSTQKHPESIFTIDYLTEIHHDEEKKTIFFNVLHEAHRTDTALFSLVIKQKNPATVTKMIEDLNQYKRNDSFYRSAQQLMTAINSIPVSELGSVTLAQILAHLTQNQYAKAPNPRLC